MEGANRMIEGVVKQLNNSGVVIECTACEACRKENAGQENVFPRKCLLSVNHGDRCSAYPIDKTSWVIATNTNEIRQLT